MINRLYDSDVYSGEGIPESNINPDKRGAIYIDYNTGDRYICSNNTPNANIWKVVDSKPYTGYGFPTSNINPNRVGAEYINLNTTQKFYCKDNTPNNNKWIPAAEGFGSYHLYGLNCRLEDGVDPQRVRELRKHQALPCLFRPIKTYQNKSEFPIIIQFSPGDGADYYEWFISDRITNEAFMHHEGFKHSLNPNPNYNPQTVPDTAWFGWGLRDRLWDNDRSALMINPLNINFKVTSINSNGIHGVINQNNPIAIGNIISDLNHYVIVPPKYFYRLEINRLHDPYIANYYNSKKDVYDRQVFHASITCHADWNKFDQMSRLDFCKHVQRDVMWVENNTFDRAGCDRDNNNTMWNSY